MAASRDGPCCKAHAVNQALHRIAGDGQAQFGSETCRLGIDDSARKPGGNGGDTDLLATMSATISRLRNRAAALYGLRKQAWPSEAVSMMRATFPVE
jgi:hypothetical protein